MKNKQNWYQKIMIGRNGPDQLSMFLVILSLLITLVSSIVNKPVVVVLSYIPLGLSVFRMFSKNVDKRRMENYRFMMKLSPVYSRWQRGIQRIKNRKVYKYFKCPFCGQKLRVPRGKGKVNVTCTKCREKFTKNT